MVIKLLRHGADPFVCYIYNEYIYIDKIDLKEMMKKWLSCYYAMEQIHLFVYM